MFKQQWSWKRRLTLGAILFLVSCSVFGMYALLRPASVPTQPALAGQLGRPAANSRISTENALPGTDTWASVGNYNISQLAAYAGATSINAGASMNVYVTSPSGTSASATLYRIGYYQDHGARQYATYSGLPISTHVSGASCPHDTSTGLVECTWSPFSITTDPSWISGIYLLRIDSNNGYRFFVYFVIRNDSYNAPILVSESSKTNQAYNDYSDESLYVSRNGDGRSRAYKVSFDRPYNTGAGTGSFFSHDVDMIRWLEASGYDVTYISDVDRINPNIFLNHLMYLDVGHDEYWATAERDNVENALDQGVNLAFGSGNESYWHIRLENSPVGPNRIITCYKDATLDPTPVAPGVTVLFSDPLLNRPENTMLGVGYESWFDDVLYNGPWVLRPPPPAGTLTVPASRWATG